MDGQEIDLTEIEMRIHTGSTDQDVDPLIEAKQGAGNAPAYRGTAYAVFERLPLADYGDRLPQVQFEVMRPLGGIAEDVRAVCLIPGATAFGLHPTRLVSNGGDGEEEWLNRHVLFGESDLSASIDELMALCPNLRHVALVVSWYGDDLRAGQCRILPGVTGPTVGAKTKELVRRRPFGGDRSSDLDRRRWTGLWLDPGGRHRHRRHRRPQGEGARRHALSVHHDGCAIGQWTARSLWRRRAGDLPLARAHRSDGRRRRR